MGLITIREKPIAANGTTAALTATATMSFDHGPEYSITVSDPFSKEEEAELEWYFEEHLRYPFLNQVRAQHAAQSISHYGERLFEQVITDQDIYTEYKQCIQNGLNTLQIEVIGSPQFHRWHWEALKDPKLPKALVLYGGTMVRKNRVPQTLKADVRPSPTINLLIIVARPFGKRDVGYRTISRPLVETLRQAQVPIQIDIIRPGTYQALDSHLRETTSRHGVGYYHVIHFDVHGAVLPYQDIAEGQQANRYLYQHPYGRSVLEPYEGEQAFLFLEDQQEDKADPVRAQDLANLLLSHHIPIAILNACQSGKEPGTTELSISESSLGSRLMQAGIQLVLAMGYSVTVSAAELLMRTFYQQLFDQHELTIAISQARQELFNNKERQAYFDQKIHLEDWLLPIVYQNQSQQLTTRAFTAQEEQSFYEEQANQYKPPNVTYGFVGRDLDILQLEKRLLTKSNLVLIRGMGGAGKTTLLHHLGWWWQTTGFVEHVFYFGYDERAWTLQQIMTTLAQHLFPQVEYLQAFQPLSPKAQQAKLVNRLRAHPHLLILDNLESITGSHLAIQHTLPQDEQNALRRFLTDLKDGRTRILLGSRSGEAWLAKGVFCENIHDLGGLDPEATSTLTDRILERYQVTKYREEKEHQRHLIDLIKLLDGFPLALEVVLSNLTRQTPSEVLAALQAGDVSLNVGSSQERTENIVRCIDYSHSNLSAEAQQLLLCLAPFTSVLGQMLLDRYTNHLKQQPALTTWPFDQWQQVIEAAINWGLLSPDPEIPSFLRIQPTLPYFLRTRLHIPEQAEICAAIETAFRELYDQVGNTLYSFLKSKDPQERSLGQLLASLEYENLVMALNLALKAQMSLRAPYMAVSSYLDTTQDQQRGLELGQMVLKGLEAYTAELRAGPLGEEIVGVLDNIATRYLLLKQYAEAEVAYQKALSLWLENTYFDADTVRKRSSSIYHQLGMVAQEQRQWPQSEQYFQQALQIYIDFNDRYAQAKTLHHLGIVAQEQQKFQQAEQYFQQALQIYIDFNDRYAQAGTLHHLGIVAQGQRKFQQAEQYFQQALQIKIDFNDRYAQASSLQGLGIVAQEQQKFQQAEQHFQQALQIYIDFNDRYAQASTLHHLGIVAQEQRQWPQAQQYFQQALQIKIDFNDRYEQASTLQGLGVVAREQRQWDKAREQFLQALTICVEYNNMYNGRGVIGSLARLWKESTDATILPAIASILDIAPDEVEKMFREIAKDEAASDEQTAIEN